MDSTRFVVKHQGRQIGKPVRDIRVAFERASFLAADLDWANLTKRQKEQAVFTVEQI